MYDRKVCTGDEKEINDALESMPSGHTTAAFAGFVFLYLYLNAKLKVFSNYHPTMWKLIALYAPLLGACLIGGALTIDEFHNWYDILAGAVIGTVFAFSSYRMVYASVWDFRCKFCLQFFFFHSLAYFIFSGGSNNDEQLIISRFSATPLLYTAPALPPWTASTTLLSPGKRAGAPTMAVPGAVRRETLLMAHAERCRKLQVRLRVLLPTARRTEGEPMGVLWVVRTRVCMDMAMGAIALTGGRSGEVGMGRMWFRWEGFRGFFN